MGDSSKVQNRGVKGLGKVAYEAYCVSVNNLSVTGVVLPKWNEQSDNLHNAWETAAQAVADEVRK